MGKQVRRLKFPLKSLVGGGESSRLKELIKMQPPLHPPLEWLKLVALS